MRTILRWEIREYADVEIGKNCIAIKVGIGDDAPCGECGARHEVIDTQPYLVLSHETMAKDPTEAVRGLRSLADLIEKSLDGHPPSA